MRIFVAVFILACVIAGSYVLSRFYSRPAAVPDHIETSDVEELTKCIVDGQVISLTNTKESLVLQIGSSFQIECELALPMSADISRTCTFKVSIPLNDGSSVIVNSSTGEIAQKGSVFVAQGRCKIPGDVDAGEGLLVIKIGRSRFVNIPCSFKQ